MTGSSLIDAIDVGVPRSARTARSGRLALTWRISLVGAAIFALAAVVRLSMIDAYVTIDESRWVQRASDFSVLIGQGRLRDTFIIGHPGVTTMWTALIGLGPERARHFSFLEGDADATRRDGYYEALIASRRPFAIVGALGVAAVSLLGWRLLGAGPGIVGGLLLSFEPFLVAHARVTHLDSGLTTYLAVAALSGLIFWLAGGSWPYLALSGVAMGLAFLTKAPSVYLVGFIPVVAGLSWLSAGRQRRTLPRLIAQLGVWSVIAAGVGFLLWPALRVDPIGTVLKMAKFTERVGGGEHDNFFAGVVTDDPGLFFYPLALVLRLAPVTLLGVALVALLWRRLSGQECRVSLFLALYCIGFMAMMTIGPKKFDRYLLPAFPMLGLLAGLGLWKLAGLARTWAHLWQAPPSTFRRCMSPAELIAALNRAATNQDASQQAPTAESDQVGERFIVSVYTAPPPTLHASAGSDRFRVAAISIVLLTVAVLGQIATLAPVFRYPLSYYSPLLGGSAFAERLILVGWGEGLDQVGDWIDAQPRPLGEPTVATSYHRVLQAQLTGSAVPLEHVRMADYVVPYVNTLQRRDEAEVLAPYLSSGGPKYTVRINGIEYARIYRGPHYPSVVESGAEIGGRVTLVRSAVAPGSGDLRPGEELTVGIRWDHATVAQERVLVQMVASDGKVVVQDERPLGADGPDERGQPGEIHRLTVPPRTPPGSYRLALRVREGRGQAALTVTSGPGLGEDLVTLRDLAVSRAP